MKKKVQYRSWHAGQESECNALASGHPGFRAVARPNPLAIPATKEARSAVVSGG